MEYDRDTYTVVVETVETEEEKVLTGYIIEVKGAIVQGDNIGEIFSELGVSLKILEELRNKNHSRKKPK